MILSQTEIVQVQINNIKKMIGTACVRGNVERKAFKNQGQACSTNLKPMCLSQQGNSRLFDTIAHFHIKKSKISELPVA